MPKVEIRQERMRRMEENKLSFEESMQRLEQIGRQLENEYRQIEQYALALFAS